MAERRSPRAVIDAARDRLEREPGLSDREIDALELPGRMPEEIRALLRATRGITIDDTPIALTGGFGLETVFPHGIALANDGAGNEWVCDVLSTGAWDRVYFASHDPPEISLAAPDLATFLAAAIDGGLEPPAFRAIALLEAPAGSDDPVVRSLGERAGPGNDVADLRRAEIGDGFEWGRAGPRTRIVRAGNAPVWAIERTHPGFFARLFGKR